MAATGRRPHPDDVLKRLARTGRGATGPEIYVGRARPFDAVRAAALTMFGLLLLVGGVAALPFVLPHNSIQVEGLDSHTYITPAGLKESEVFFTVKPRRALQTVRVRIDGEPASVVVDGTRLRWVPPPLAEGRHTLTLRSGSRFLWRAAASKRVVVEVDSVDPTLTVAAPSLAVTVDQPLTVHGTVEKDATVKVNGKTVPVVDGSFSRQFSTPPIGMVRVEATDRAGNVTLVEQPSGVKFPEIQGVHMSGLSWVTPSLRDPVLRMAEEGRINTVVLDLKDESGRVSYRSGLTRVNDIGANAIIPGAGQYDLVSAVNRLHERGIRVMGRIVAFRDPFLTRSSINANRLDEVVQTASGDPYDSAYGAFANPLSSSVQNYLLDLVREAADAGVDDILFDYLRRPEGALSEMRFVGLEQPSAGALEKAIVEFVQRAAKRLEGTKTRLGVSVFGIAAKYPEQIGQDIRALARTVDYIAPMVYPSHWRSGNYNVVDPANAPYEIVSRSLKDFNLQMQGTDAAMMPWLQDFSLAPGRRYGAEEVRAQITAAREQNSTGFLLWDSKVTYTEEGIPADASVVPFRPVVTVPAGAADGLSVAPTVPATVDAAAAS